MYYTRLILILICSLLISSAFSQSKSYYDEKEYLKTRHELNFGIGVSSCQTDVGGSKYNDQELNEKFAGKIFRSIYDTDISSSNFVLNAGYVYHFKKKISFRGNLIFSRTSGDDKQSPEFYRNNRNLNFRTGILEFSAITEFYLKKANTGNKFNLKNVEGHKISSNALSSLGFYLVGGVGGFLYIPKAKTNFVYPDVTENDDFTAVYINEYQKLRPLHTEGQGYEGLESGDDFNVAGKKFKDDKTYSKIAVCIPFGFGIQKAFNAFMGVKIEAGIRYTFTDYLDDVSGLYYDKSLLAQYNENGNLAATMSGTGSGDAPSSSGIPGTYRDVGYAIDGIYPNGATPDNSLGGTNSYYIDKTFTQAGFKRGNPDNNDYYGFLNVSFYKTFSTHGKVYKSIHSKQKRKIKASF